MEPKFFLRLSATALGAAFFFPSVLLNFNYRAKPFCSASFAPVLQIRKGPTSTMTVPILPGISSAVASRRDGNYFAWIFRKFQIGGEAAFTLSNLRLILLPFCIFAEDAFRLIVAGFIKDFVCDQIVGRNCLVYGNYTFLVKF